MDSTDLSCEQMNDHLANPGNFDAAAAVAIMRSISRRCRSCPAIVLVLLSLPRFHLKPLEHQIRSIAFAHDGNWRLVSPHENVRDPILAQVVSVAQATDLPRISEF